MCLLLIAEHSTFWCIAIFYRDEELNSQETTQEEDPKIKDSLENTAKDVSVCFQWSGCQIVEL